MKDQNFDLKKNIMLERKKDVNNFRNNIMVTAKFSIKKFNLPLICAYLYLYLYLY